VTPLPIDDRRVGKLADACDLIDAENPRRPKWRERKDAAYAALAAACNLAATNAKGVQS